MREYKGNRSRSKRKRQREKDEGKAYRWTPSCNMKQRGNIRLQRSMTQKNGEMSTQDVQITYIAEKSVHTINTRLPYFLALAWRVHLLFRIDSFSFSG